MILPSTYFATLTLIIVSMLGLGLWGNTFKLTGNWRFELYYFDFALGVMIAATIAAFTVGSLGFDGFSFRDDILHASKKQEILGFMAGVIFNLGNMLLVAAISVAGMSVAFPVGMGFAIVIGVILTYALRPNGSPVLYFAGALLIAIAIAVNAQAYKTQKLNELDELVRTGKVKSTRKIVSIKGVYLALAGGLLIGVFPPLLRKSMEGDAGIGPYSVGFVFALGILLSTFLFNLFFMNLPVAGQPLEILDFLKANIGQHFLGWLGGAIWFVGMLCGLIAGAAEGKAAVGAPLQFGLAQAAVLIAALCGLLLWKEFAQVQGKVSALLGVMFALLALGLAMISVAPMVAR